MEKTIEAIIFDVGNTLRIVVEDSEFMYESKRQLVDLIGPPMSPDQFFEHLEARYSILRKHAKDSLIEVSEKEMWTRWMLPDYPAEKVAPLAGKLTRLWRDCDGRRVPRPDVTTVVMELHNRGYKLGIIANTITESEIPDWLESDQLTNYFDIVILSSKIGIRKPNPEIYLEAARRIGVSPRNCAYVGDNPVRDVEGSQAAGYGMVILLHEPETLKKEPPTDGHRPDRTINELSELLDIYQPIS
jgi:HAD superfamily hydrolase (TIGR01662 family)